MSFGGDRKNFIRCMLAALFVSVGVFLAPVNAKALSEADAEYVEEANVELRAMAEEYEVMASVYLCDYYDVCAAPSTNSESTERVYSGQLVCVFEEAVDEAGNVWAHVRFQVKGAEYSGYILRKNLAISDERFLEWENEYAMKAENWPQVKKKLFSAKLFSAAPNGAEPSGEEPEIPAYDEDVMEFPESYREKLQALKNEHPNWKFVKLYTGIDFQNAINNELTGGKSLVYKSFDECCKEAPYDDGNWYYASEDILKYYMDPRNALDITHIFCFEQLTYNAEYHTKEALEDYLKGTFMTNEGGKKVPLMDISYGSLLFGLAKNEYIKVSPFMLASRIVQEQGSGNSALISGTYPGFEGVYNYFNIGATGTSTTEVIVNGLTYGKNHWMGQTHTDPSGEVSVYKTDQGAYNSITYGARFLSSSYITGGQDTLYLQKYQVNPHANHSLYSHQYMQNISAPYSEGYNTKEMYLKAGALENPFVFKIPVFENMPEYPCEKPTDSTEIRLTLPEGVSENVVTAAPSVWIDGIEYTSTERNGYIVVDYKDENATNAVIYKYDTDGICIGMYIWMLDYVNHNYKATYEPSLEDLLIYEGFSIRITGVSGIRYMTSINKDLKNTLISGNVDGYKLSEYGTVVMLEKNMPYFPFILGGEKTTSGVSYGYNSKGVFTNYVQSTVDGRERFTSVLVDLKPEKYETKYAFRSYIKLKKGEKVTTLYGPGAGRSIYELAVKYVDRKTYAEGSSQYEFLIKLISDAEAVRK